MRSIANPSEKSSHSTRLSASAKQGTATQFDSLASPCALSVPPCRLRLRKARSQRVTVPVEVACNPGLGPTGLGLRKARFQRGGPLQKLTACGSWEEGLGGEGEQNARGFTRPHGFAAQCSSVQLSAAQTFKMIDNYRAAQLQLKIFPELQLSCNQQLKPTKNGHCSSCAAQAAAHELHLSCSKFQRSLVNPSES